MLNKRGEKTLTTAPLDDNNDDDDGDGDDNDIKCKEFVLLGDLSPAETKRCRHQVAWAAKS